MSSKTHRINVILDAEDLEIIQILSRKQKLSMSCLIKKIVQDQLEEYEDMKLIQKIEQRENENNKLISHEEYWKESKQCIQFFTMLDLSKETLKKSHLQYVEL